MNNKKSSFKRGAPENKPKKEVTPAPKKEKIVEQPKKKSTKISINKVISELKKDLSKNGITAKNMKTKKKLMSERVTNYFSKNKINKKHKTQILTKLVESIIRG